ncbi:DUF393 domain-containing protein [Photobacterium ganghwense]|nr:DUF393 domain-containing protein [Photobacterium ganghwense]
MTMTPPALTLFYDGFCPLCVAEMQRLHHADQLQRLCLEDIQQDGFGTRYPDIDPVKAREILHGKTANGQLLLGLDATYAAWSLVGQKRWIGLLRLPVIRLLADAGYRFFAQHRYRFSYLLTGRSYCQTCRLDSTTCTGESSSNQDR